MSFDAMPNHAPAIVIERWGLWVPLIGGACPVSGNPVPGTLDHGQRVGSWIGVYADTQRGFPEVLGLKKFVHQVERTMIGGLRNEAGDLVVRDQEQQIQTITQALADAWHAPIRVHAVLELRHGAILDFILSTLPRE